MMHRASYLELFLWSCRRHLCRLEHPPEKGPLRGWPWANVLPHQAGLVVPRQHGRQAATRMMAAGGMPFPVIVQVLDGRWHRSG